MSDTPTTIAVEPTAAPATESTWVSQITDADAVGTLQTKGWDKLSPTEAVAQSMKAYRNAEKMLGVPADQLLRLPTRPDDEAGWKNIYQRLGAPDKPEGYTFEGVSIGNDESTAAFKAVARQAAAEMGIPKDMAERMAQTFSKFVNDTHQAQTAEATAALQGEQQRLAQDWGSPDSARFRGNMFIADQAAEKLGVTPEALTKLKDGLGASEVAKMFHKIGLAIGEDRYVSGGNPANQGLMSREQAVARRNELMADKQWVDRYLTGGAAEQREMMAVNTLISS